MGRPALTSYEEVAKICAELDQRGELTLDRVMLRLGKSSKGTVHKHYQVWQRQAAAAAAGELGETLSANLRGAVLREIEVASANRVAVHTERIAALEEQSTLLITDLQAAEAESEGAREQLAAATVAADQAARTHAEALAEQQGKVEALEAQIVALEQKLAREVQGAESARMDAAKAINRLEIAEDARKRLDEHNGKLLVDLKTSQAALGAAEQRAAVAEERAKNRDEQLSEATKIREAQQSRLVAVEKRLSEAERELAVCATERKGLEARITSSEARAKSLEEALERARQQGNVSDKTERKNPTREKP